MQVECSVAIFMTMFDIQYNYTCRKLIARTSRACSWSMEESWRKCCHTIFGKPMFIPNIFSLTMTYSHLLYYWMEEGSLYIFFVLLWKSVAFPPNTRSFHFAIILYNTMVDGRWWVDRNWLVSIEMSNNQRQQCIL